MGTQQSARWNATTPRQANGNMQDQPKYQETESAWLLLTDFSLQLEDMMDRNFRVQQSLTIQEQTSGGILHL